MNKFISLMTFVFIASSAAALAQTNTFPASGNVGIGTTAPVEQLDVYGGISSVGMNLLPALASTSAWSPVAWGAGDGSISVVSASYEGQTVNALRVVNPQNSSWTFQRYFVNQNVLPPKAKLTFTVYVKNDVAGAFRCGLSEGEQFGGAPTQLADCFNTRITTSDGLWTLYRSTMTTTTWSAINAYMGKDYNSVGAVTFAYPVLTVDSGVGRFVLGGFQIDQSTGAVYTTSGNVGIGTTSPARKLHITGDVEIDGNLYFGSNSQPQSAAFSGVVCGGDYAESVDVIGERKGYEPGDLLVIDKHDPSKFVKSREPYSTMVAGIYSTKPGVVGRRQTTPKSTEEIPMAVVGIVPAKVSTENGAIEAGDLLVSSSTPGYAMKGTDRSRFVGAVIGKAMGTLDAGTGMIEVLVTLQ